MVVRRLVALISALFALTISTVWSATEQMHTVSVIPQPLLLEYNEGEFVLGPGAKILYQKDSAEAKSGAEMLAARLQAATGYNIAVKKTSAESKEQNSIQFLTSQTDATLGGEGYSLRVEHGRIIARAPHGAGLFYAAETIRQLFPPELESKTAAMGVAWSIPALTIIDKPRFAWRGNMLDCSRSFMPKEFVLHYLDILAYYKINNFHWHLTDDQGWRIEIKKYPRLTEFGAWRGEGADRAGGFYTQADVKEVIAYAQKLNITIVPEIEMPGHSSAAIASYPNLSCKGDLTVVPTEWGIHKTILCAGKEETFQFIEGVLGEVADLFPGEYIHIGGDEAPKDRWKECPLCQARIKKEGLKNEQELQAYFTKRAQDFLTSRGKKTIGWDEIYEGGLPPGAIVEYWNHEKNFLGAIADGHGVVTAPTKYVYFDYPEFKDETKPKWMRILPLETVYSFDPILPGVKPWQERLVYGAEAPLWTEHAPQERVEYQLLPRLAALSEVVWSRRGPKDYGDFLTRLDANYARLDAMGIQYNKYERETRAAAAAAATPVPTPAQ